MPRRGVNRLLLLPLLALAAASLGGCGVPLISSSSTPQSVSVVDISRSTWRLRKKQVQCTSELKFSTAEVPTIVCWLSRSLSPDTVKKSAVSLLLADGNTYEEPNWTIDGYDLKSTDAYKRIAKSSNSKADTNALQSQAAVAESAILVSGVQKAARSVGPGGSDLSAVIQVVGRKINSMDGPVTLHVFTDGGSNVAELNLVRRHMTQADRDRVFSGDTAAKINRIIDEIQRKGEMPKLQNKSGDPVTVDFTGIGYGIDSRGATRFLSDFWDQYVARAGGIVAQ